MLESKNILGCTIPESAACFLAHTIDECPRHHDKIHKLKPLLTIASSSLLAMTTSPLGVTTALMRRLELCQQFGIGTLLVVADFVEALDETALSRAVVSLAQAAQWAAGFDSRRTFEPSVFNWGAVYGAEFLCAAVYAEYCRSVACCTSECVADLHRQRCGREGFSS